jgi:hypothetical protein
MKTATNPAYNFAAQLKFDPANFLDIQQSAKVAEAALKVLKEHPVINNFLEGGAASLENEDIRRRLIDELNVSAGTNGCGVPTTLFSDCLFHAAQSVASSFVYYLKQEAPQKLLLPLEFDHLSQHLEGHFAGMLAVMILSEAPNFQQRVEGL